MSADKPNKLIDHILVNLPLLVYQKEMTHQQMIRLLLSKVNTTVL